ncbi:unnamed protein product [Ambrosiozyma monospora]|uniref:Unnamed protein product n=1 Tax=Ambrosiozyma monospora TaxID=43982 RepID=A0A9W6T034_AMBMO|nr:unnamed protein product [Ambrosiozyma monospora]
MKIQKLSEENEMLRRELKKYKDLVETMKSNSNNSGTRSKNIDTSLSVNGTSAMAEAEKSKIGSFKLNDTILDLKSTQTELVKKLEERNERITSLEIQLKSKQEDQHKIAKLEQALTQFSTHVVQMDKHNAQLIKDIKTLQQVNETKNYSIEELKKQLEEKEQLVAEDSKNFYLKLDHLGDRVSFAKNPNSSSDNNNNINGMSPSRQRASSSTSTSTVASSTSSKSPILPQTFSTCSNTKPITRAVSDSVTFLKPNQPQPLPVPLTLNSTIGSITSCGKQVKKTGLNLRIVKPMRGGQNEDDDDDEDEDSSESG